MSNKISKQEEVYICLVNKSEDYIEQHLNEAILLSNLANYSNFSDYHFHRIFKKYSNITLKKFITRFKLERAAIFMSVNRSLSLTIIASKELSLNMDGKAITEIIDGHMNTQQQQSQFGLGRI